MFTWAKIMDDIVAGKSASDFPNYAPCADYLVFPTLKSWEKGRILAEWKVEKRFLNSRGHVFGGYFGVLSDMTFCYTAMSVLNGNEGFITNDLRISYFRPASGGTLHIEGRVVNRTRQSVHMESDFKNSEGKLLTKATGIMSVVPMSTIYPGRR